MVAGGDDFFVSRAAAARWEQFCVEVPDDFGREIVAGMANTVGEVPDVVRSAIAAIQTMPMFGGRKAVWLKDVNFMADSVTGRSENTLEEVRRLQEVLEKVDPATVLVLLSVSPVDRRRREFKWFVEHGDVQVVGGDDAGETLRRWLQDEAKTLGVSLRGDVSEVLVERVQGHARLAVEELRKLVTYLGPDGGALTPDLVLELVPAFGETGFFEVADAFYSLSVERTLAAVRKHFFAGHDARPLLMSLQNRNRLLIQLRVLKDSGLVAIGDRGMPRGALEAAKGRLGDLFPGAAAKSSLNVFSQSPYYVGRLASSANQVPLRRLIDFQGEFLRAFRELLERPQDAEGVIRDLVLRCLSAREAA